MDPRLKEHTHTLVHPLLNIILLHSPAQSAQRRSHIECQERIYSNTSIIGMLSRSRRDHPRPRTALTPLGATRIVGSDKGDIVVSLPHSPLGSCSPVPALSWPGGRPRPYPCCSYISRNLRSLFFFLLFLKSVTFPLLESRGNTFNFSPEIVSHRQKRVWSPALLVNFLLPQ